MPHRKTVRRLSALCGLAILVGLLNTSPVVAANPLILSLSSVQDLARQRNTSLQQRVNTAALSEVSLEQSRANLYPDLRVSAGASERFDRASAVSGGLATENSEALSLQVSSSLNLFNGFGDVAGIEAARQQAAASTGDLLRLKELIVYQATAAYLQAVLDRDLMEIDAERLEAERLQLARTESLYEVGERPRADLLQQQAAVARAELQRLEAERTYISQLLALKDLLALDPRTEVKLETTPGVALVDVPDDMILLIEQARRQRADLTAQAARVRAAAASVRVARSGGMPSLDLSVGMGTSYSSRDVTYGVGDQLLDANPSASAGLSLTIPLFDREQTDAAVRRARLQLANEELVYDALVRTVGLQLEEALLNHRIATAQLMVSLSQLDYAREALAAIEVRYEEGLATLVELSLTRADYIAAAGDRATAETMATLRRLEIELYMGGTL